MRLLCPMTRLIINKNSAGIHQDMLAQTILSAINGDDNILHRISTCNREDATDADSVWGCGFAGFYSAAYIA